VDSIEFDIRAVSEGPVSIDDFLVSMKNLYDENLDLQA
jgi:hypothetical protein